MTSTAGEKQRFLEQELAMKVMQLGMMVSAGDINQSDADRQIALFKEMVADYQALHIAERTHELKSWPDYFKPVAVGEKTFEIRKHDRDFQKGDLLILREWDDRTQRYTGAKVERRIRYIETGIGQGAIAPLLGLMRGWCVLGLDHPLSGDVVEIKSEQPAVPLDAGVPSFFKDDHDQAKRLVGSGPSSVGSSKQEVDNASNSGDTDRGRGA